MNTVVPVRCCAACRTRAPQQTLIRVVRAPGGAIKVDHGPHRAAGRGAYLCRAASCLRKGPRALGRALGAPVTDELLEELERQAVESEEGMKR